MFNQTSFVDLCVKELELCGVHEGETVAVLSQMSERARLRRRVHDGGAQPRRRYVPRSAARGVDEPRRRRRRVDGRRHAAGQQPAAIEALKQADLVDRPDLPALLEGAARDPGGRRAHASLHRADRQPGPPVPDAPTSADASRSSEELLAKAKTMRITNRPAPTSCTSWRLPSHDRVRLHGQAGPLGPLACWLPVHGGRRRRRRRQGRRRARRHPLPRSRSSSTSPSSSRSRRAGSWTSAAASTPIC